jgi:hypothetical protein
MHLDLTDDEAAALTQELHDFIENALAKLRPEPVREHCRRGRCMRRHRNADTGISEFSTRPTDDGGSRSKVR